MSKIFVTDKLGREVEIVGNGVRNLDDGSIIVYADGGGSRAVAAFAAGWVSWRRKDEPVEAASVTNVYVRGPISIDDLKNDARG